MAFKVGDVVEALRGCTDVVKGGHYEVRAADSTFATIADNAGHGRRWLNSEFKLVRRAGEPEKPASVSILAEAAKIAGVDRSEAYGHPLVNHQRIAGLWNAYIEAKKPGPLTPQDVARMMILLKIARDLHAPRRDNRVDICGYAECLDLMEGKE